MANHDVVDSHANIIQKFMDAKFLWQFTSFLLSADLACAFFYGFPLSSVRLDHIDSSIPVGAILWFLVSFAFLTGTAWTMKAFFFSITHPVVHEIRWALRKRKTKEEYKADAEERASHTVYSSDLRDFAYKSGNGVLYDVYNKHEDWRSAGSWTLMFQFLVGFLLVLVPLVPRCSAQLLFVNEFGISDVWVLVPALLLMFHGAHSFSDCSTDVYVGRVMAPIICPPKKNEWER